MAAFILGLLFPHAPHVQNLKQDLPYVVDGSPRLRIWVSTSPAGHETVRITNTPGSSCTYAVRYHLATVPRVEILYSDGRPAKGSGECYPSTT